MLTGEMGEWAMTHTRAGPGRVADSGQSRLAHWLTLYLDAFFASSCTTRLRIRKRRNRGHLRAIGVGGRLLGASNTPIARGHGERIGVQPPPVHPVSAQEDAEMGG